MASITATRIAHATLVASTVDTVTLSVLSRSVTVVNRGTGDIFVTTGDDLIAPATPTVGGAEEWVVPSNTTVAIPVYSQVPSKDSASAPSKTVVKLISSGTPAYSVIG